ncbi:hypothetical protein CDA25_18635 [Klebsiella pneumoniae]|nr:hypothetical protein CDA25_18635 [Klebsiella pneumoniae]
MLLLLPKDPYWFQREVLHLQHRASLYQHIFSMLQLIHALEDLQYFDELKSPLLSKLDLVL